MFKNDFTFAKNFLLLVFLFFCTPSFHTPSCASSAYNMRTIPENGVNVYWPVLKDYQYFTHNGLHAKNVTLRSIMAMDCAYIVTHYAKDRRLILDQIELLTLTQFALRGLDIQATSPIERKGIAFAEIAKRLRQFGRIQETKAFIGPDHAVPSSEALCHIAEILTSDMKRQLYHMEQQWDFHAVADKDSEDESSEDESDDEEDD